MKKEYQGLLRLGVFWLLTLTSSADEATKEEYQKRLDRYDLEGEPEKHRVLASWCKRNYPSKFSYHERAFNLHQFSEYEDKMRDTPSAAELKKARDFATKLELHDKAGDYHTKWGEMQYALYAKRLKPGNVTMMKQLLAWAIKEGVEEIPSVQKLASSIIEAEADNSEARNVLGHFQVEGDWSSKEELLGGMNALDVHDRIRVHKIFAEARMQTEKSYPIRPTAGMEDLGQYFLFQPKKSPDAKFYLHAKNYSRTKPCRLILSLHGGGSGGFEKASLYAGYGIKNWAGLDSSEPHVAIAPIASNHVVSSWSDRTNVMQILNALEEVSERFNIDRKQIYVTGQSMGGGGTCYWYLCFPEFAAASVARTGWFHHDNDKQKDCLKKPILLIQGGKDEAFRLESREKFLELAPKRNGNASLIMHPDEGHLLPWDKQEEAVLEFFGKHVNDIEPDWDVMRAAAKGWTKG